jgi:predicted regulator of Ras-like GTPase activity (Roadblock/LC7/MglB family)
MVNHDSALDAIIETRGVRGVYEVDQDGFLLGSIDTGVEDREAIAAVAAVAVLAAGRVGEVLRLGSLSSMMLEFGGGTMILAERASSIIVVITAQHAPLGEIFGHLKAGRAAADTGDSR